LYRRALAYIGIAESSSKDTLDLMKNKMELLGKARTDLKDIVSNDPKNKTASS